MAAAGQEEDIVAAAGVPMRPMPPGVRLVYEEEDRSW